MAETSCLTDKKGPLFRLADPQIRRFIAEVLSCSFIDPGRFPRLIVAMPMHEKYLRKCQKILLQATLRWIQV